MATRTFPIFRGLQRALFGGAVGVGVSCLLVVESSIQFFCLYDYQKRYLSRDDLPLLFLLEASASNYYIGNDD
jgi:hypothetical protein